ncbi:hypothetical protein L1887_28472 [Cichorium endivia]|nr:hypothetical protein L1887_28472 [Cichorium endivia]
MHSATLFTLIIEFIPCHYITLILNSLKFRPNRETGPYRIHRSHLRSLPPAIHTHPTSISGESGFAVRLRLPFLYGVRLRLPSIDRAL